MAILPHGEAWHLGSVADGQFTPIQACPAAINARISVSPGGDSFTVLDSDRKRASLYTILPHEPWIEPAVRPAFLPKDCVGHATIGIDGGLFVGGHGKSGESFWLRSRDDADAWREIPLPSAIRRPGKAVDGLHWNGECLIAVDNIVRPKWLLLYDLSAGHGPTLIDQIELPSHVTHERVVASCLGEGRLGVISRGINHGRASTHVWDLETTRFEQVRHWAFRHDSPRPSLFAGLAPIDTDESTDDTALVSTYLSQGRAIASLNNDLLVACGDHGIVAFDRKAGDPANPLDGVRQIATRGLRSVDHLVVPLPDQRNGVFAVGQGSSGKLDFEWMSAATIRAAD